MLEDFAGLYYSEELGVVYTIRVDEGELLAVRPRVDTRPVPLTHSAAGPVFGRLRVADLGRGVRAGSPTRRVTGFTVSSVRTQGVRFERVSG